MIRNEAEYQEALKRLHEDERAMEDQQQELQDMGLTGCQLAKAMEPLVTFHKQLKDELDWYCRIKQGDIPTINRITDIGKSLIAVRIASGLTQKDLAQILGCSEAQVSRDERNDYHGISTERAQRIFDAIKGAKVEIKIEIEGPMVEKEPIPA